MKLVEFRNGAARRIGPVLAAASFLSACSGDDGSGGNGAGSAAGGSGGNGIGISFAASPGVGEPPPTSTADSCGESRFEECVAQSYEGESIPLDIFLMFDQSGSMLNDVGGMTRLDAVRRATAEFLRARESTNIGVGIGYFGHLPLGETSCNDGDYESPAVDITVDHEAVISSLDARMPVGETPTGAALRGACSYATGWKKRAPGRELVILLVTDGVPEAPVSCTNANCCPTLSDAVNAASACQKAGIRTFVLGVGPALGNLADIARSGGTGDAYLVEDRDASTEVLRALNEIRGAATIPCELSIPNPAPPSTIDFSRVNLSLSPSGGCDFEPVYFVPDLAECPAEGGWAYDDAVAPSSVKLCPATCDRVSLPSARMRFSIGCETTVAPIF